MLVRNSMTGFVTAAVVVILDSLTKILALHLWRTSVVYDPQTTFSHVSRLNLTLGLILALSAVLMASYGGIGGGLIAGGILGNVTDKPIPGVVDFIHLGNTIFNLADVAILVGAVWIVVRTILTVQKIYGN